MIQGLINKIKGWWKNMFDYNKIIKDFNLDSNTSEDILRALQEWNKIYNGQEPWIDSETSSLHVAKTISEKVAEAAVVEFNSVCSEPTLNKFYQKFLRNIQKNTELMIGKSCILFKPYYENGVIRINVIQADKLIPVKFDDTGELLGCITIDQIVDGATVYTRLEYNELIGTTMLVKNIAYKGRTNDVILANKINLNSVDKWKDIQPESAIDGVDRLIGGFASMRNVNTLDNDSPLGMPIWYGGLEPIKQVDKQWSRTIWEYEGAELAIDVDETVLDVDKKGNTIYPKGKKRLFRKFAFQGSSDKTYNIFNPEIRDSSLFNGLNEFLRQVEVECHLEHGTLCKAEISPKTAQEIKQMKQTYYITVSNIQKAMQQAMDDLLYGIYVLCKLYGIPVQSSYTTEYDWDDSILVDKESSRNQALIERNNGITSDVQYIIDTKGYKEAEAVEFVKRQKEYRKLTETNEETEVDEE